MRDRTVVRWPAPRTGTTMLLILLLVTAAPALAQDSSEPESDSQDLTELSLDQLINLKVETVEGASKYEQKITEAPASVTVITAEEIRAYGYRTMAEVVNSVGGLFFTNDRQYEYLGMRGFGRPGDYNTRVLMLVDGHRVNDNIYGSGAIDTEFHIDVDLIERVEVIRGPSSSLYGTGAFFGVINVITRSGGEMNGVEASVEAASYDTYKGRLSYGNRFANGVELLLSGSLLDSEGDDHYYAEYDDPETNNGIAAAPADDHRYSNLFAKLSIGDFTFRGAFADREKGIPTGAWESVFNDPRTRVWDSQGYVEAEYDHEFSDGSNVEVRLFLHRYDYEGEYAYDYSGEEDEEPYISIGRDTARGDWWGFEARHTRRLGERHRLTGGLEYQDNFRQDQGYYDEFEVYLDDRRDSSYWALYLQDEVTLGEKVILNAGLRYDHYDTFGDTTNPRLALIYRPVERTVLKLLYGEAFRAPNAYELYYHDGGYSQSPSPDLEPETITTWELVAEQYFNEQIRGSLSGYYYEIDDLISETFDADDLLIFENVDRVEARGIELELSGRCEFGARARLSYAYQTTEDQRTGQILDNSPEHLAKLNISSPLVRKDVFAGFELHYISDRFTVQDTVADAYWLANLTLFSRELFGGLVISASAYNLFDETYGHPVSGANIQDVIIQDGRSLRIKLTYRF